MAGCQDLLAGLLIRTARSAPRRAAACLAASAVSHG